MTINNTVYWQRILILCMGCCVVSLAVAAGDAEQSLSPAANEFINKGAAAILEQCDLPKRQCNGKPLKVRSADIGESNGEKKSFETLLAPGMEALVIFTASMRSKYSLSSVVVSNADWPDASGVKIGMDRDVAMLALGEPNGGTKNSCDVYYDDASGAEAHVCYRAGKLGRIRWEYVWD